MTIKELEQKANENDGLSVYLLGRAYYSGEFGVNVDYVISAYANPMLPHC